MTNQKTNLSNGNKRGPKLRHTDIELKEIALKIKMECKNQTITPSLLEKETGIGRNTWTRRIKAFLDDINTPIHRDLGIAEGDTIYFPNVEALFELYGGNKNRIINELHKFEQLLQDIYQEMTVYKKQAEEYLKYKEEISNKDEVIKKIKRQLTHYQTEYEKIIVSSVEPHLRQKYGITNNILEFNEYRDRNESLDNLNSLFPSEDKNSDFDSNEEKIDKLKNMFNDFIE